MDRSTHPTTRERRHDERNVWRTGLAVSVLLHVLVFVAWPSGNVPISPYAAAGPRRGDFEAAPGGGMEAVNVQERTREPITPPPAPTVSVAPVAPVSFEDEPAVETADILGERPGSEGPGLEEGTGEGDGGTADEGFYSMVPPSPRGMIIPPSDEELEGNEIEVWVFVDETGQVVPDSTRLDPPTDDSDFNERLREEASEWVFEPAREGGEAVAAWFPYTISM